MSSKTVNLFKQHLPSVDAGQYILEVTSHNNLLQEMTERTSVNVTNYQHYIPDHECMATYPLKFAEGNYKSTIPHVEFRRSTLPWEFKVLIESTNERIPYIFLLILKETEISTIDEPIDRLSKINLSKFPLDKLTNSIPTNQQDHFTIMNIPNDLRHLIPNPTDVKSLAHVRENKNKRHLEDGIPTFTSVLLANRIVDSGIKYRAFVCSYAQLQNNVYTIPSLLTTNTNYDLIVLNEWYFESTVDSVYQLDEGKLNNLFNTESFDNHNIHPICNSEFELINYINNLPVRYQQVKSALLINNSRQDINRSKLLEISKYEGKSLKAMLTNLNFGPWISNHNYQSSSLLNHLKVWGKVPLEHELKGGGKIISFYQSPFTHIQIPNDLSNQPISTDQQLTEFMNKLSINGYLPDHPDKLIWYNGQVKMLDMTYSAAWQLGRILILNNTKVVQELKKWKSSIRRTTILKNQNRNNHILRLSIQTSINKIPEIILHFVQQILTFQTIPYYYLTPHYSFLPEENVRYFKIDNKWMISLLMGVFSIGDPYKLTNFISDLLSNYQIKKLFYYKQDYFGAIWNSSIPKYFPYIQVDCDNQKAFDYNYKLNDKVRLYISKEKFSKINIYMENEHMHYGLNDQYNANLDLFRIQNIGNENVTDFESYPNLKAKIPYGIINKAPYLQLNIKNNVQQRVQAQVERNTNKNSS